MEKFEFIVGEQKASIRLDKFLSEEFSVIKPEINRSKIQQLMAQNLVVDVEGNALKTASQKVKLNQKITVSLPLPQKSDLVARKIDFEIIFEDEDLIVINKPANLTVHPGAGNVDNTLVNGLLFSHANKLSTINGEMRPGIVHRLDKDTSGLMLVAKNDLTHQILSQRLKDRQIKRHYLAFIYGVMSPTNGVIDKNITRCRNNRLKMTISKIKGRNAVTNYETKAIFGDNFASLVECKLQTGRTHQIRVHFESQKHSLIGDQTYNSCKKNIPDIFDDNIKDSLQNLSRQALHSYKIGFLHPKTDKEMAFEIDLPADLKKLEKCLKLL